MDLIHRLYSTESSMSLSPTPNLFPLIFWTLTLNQDQWKKRPWLIVSAFLFLSQLLFALLSLSSYVIYNRSPQCPLFMTYCWLKGNYPVGSQIRSPNQYNAHSPMDWHYIPDVLLCRSIVKYFLFCVREEKMLNNLFPAESERYFPSSLNHRALPVISPFGDLVCRLLLETKDRWPFAND